MSRPTREPRRLSHWIRSKNPSSSAFLLATIAAILVLVGGVVEALPTIDYPVVDEADVLSSEEIDRISTKLYEHHETTGVQMAVLFVETTGDQPIEDFSLAVAEKWEGGHADRDDGVLLTFAIDDRRNRLEIGYGLEDIITDAQAGRMLDGATALLRHERYGDAAEQIVDEVIARTQALKPGETRPDVLSSGWIFTSALILFFLGAMQAFFWSASRSTLKGLKESQDEEEEDSNGFFSGFLLTLISSIVIPPVFIGLTFVLLGGDLSTIKVEPFQGNVMVLWVILVPVFLGTFAYGVGSIIPRPHQTPSLFFTIGWWLVPMITIGAIFYGFELPPHWDVPITTSAIVWAYAIWLLPAAIGLLLFPLTERSAVLGLYFLIHHAVLGYPLYYWFLDVDLFTAFMAGTFGFCVYLFFWLFVFMFGGDYRAAEGQGSFWSSGSSSGGLSSGGGGFSSSGGGFSGGGGSFGGGGASGSW